MGHWLGPFTTVFPHWVLNGLGNLLPTAHALHDFLEASFSKTLPPHTDYETLTLQLLFHTH